MSTPPRPPHAERRPVVTERHGDRRRDCYAWLKDDRWQEVMRDPSILEAGVRAHLEAENAYTDAVMAGTLALQERLFAQMKGRIKEDDASVPSPDGAFEYSMRYALGGQHPMFCRKARGGAGPETLLLDGDARAEGHPYFRVAQAEHSPDHRLFAWSEDLNGSERYTIRLRDIDSGELLPDALPEAQGGFAWSEDARYLFYTTIDDRHRPSRVYRHRVGSDAGQDVLVYDEPDPGFFVGVHVTESRRFVVIDSHDHVTSELRLIDMASPEGAPRVVAAREAGVEYSLSHHGDRLILLTNDGGAEDFKLVEAPLAATERRHWRDLLAHRPGTLIVNLTVFAGALVRLERVDALPRLVVTPLDAAGLHEQAAHAIAFDEEAYALGVAGGYEFDTPWLRFVYSSPTTPARTYDYHMGERRRVLRKEQEVPSGHDPAHYRTRRLFANAPDGERVPVTLVHHRDTPTDGSAPVLLYGYGSYGISIPADFATNRLSLADRGFIYAVAHVRGGMERGYRWYREGKLMDKRNTFTDFVAAAEGLIEQGMARPGRIACHGASAGGMLVGAVANMRPDLWMAVVGEVPFVDVLDTMCDADLPLTPPEWPEWGNPIESAEAYAYIRSYSPYDNVTAQAYPPILATGGLTDPRVTYWEPAKWVARLRERRTDGGLTVLRTNMSAGHGGAAGRFDRLKETALIYAFVLMAAGHEEAAPA